MQQMLKTLTTKFQKSHLRSARFFSIEYSLKANEKFLILRKPLKMRSVSFTPNMRKNLFCHRQGKNDAQGHQRQLFNLGDVVEHVCL